MSQSTVMLKSLAVRLANLSVEDRDWLCGQLSDRERARLEGMIAEAIALGLNRDPEAVARIAEQTVSRADAERDAEAGLRRELPPFWRQILDGIPAAPEVDAVSFDQSPQVAAAGRGTALRAWLLDWARQKQASRQGAV